nr:hypothetical protein CFP56_57862 [Quercus suber]
MNRKTSAPQGTVCTRQDGFDQTRYSPALSARSAAELCTGAARVEGREGRVGEICRNNTESIALRLSLRCSHLCTHSSQDPVTYMPMPILSSSIYGAFVTDVTRARRKTVVMLENIPTDVLHDWDE